MQSCDFGKLITKEDEKRELFSIFKTYFGIDKEDMFLGNHPVGLKEDRIPMLLESDYFVCEKSDGIRIMMLIYKKCIFFYDRKNEFYQVDYMTKNEDVYFFDGEMYEEKGLQVYAIFDALIARNKCLVERDLTKRLGESHFFVTKTMREILLQSNETKYLRFSIIMKNMIRSYGFPEVLKAIPNLKHKNDGLIFTPVFAPYVPFERSQILKWKPPHLNTVDFLIQKSSTPGIYNLLCSVETNQFRKIGMKQHTKRDILFGTYQPETDTRECDETKEYNENFSKDDFKDNLENKIGEFSFDISMEIWDMSNMSLIKGGWSLHKIRTDKDTPNNIKIALDLCNSISEDLNETKLKSFYNLMRENYKKREESERIKRIRL